MRRGRSRGVKRHNRLGYDSGEVDVVGRKRVLKTSSEWGMLI